MGQSDHFLDKGSFVLEGAQMIRIWNAPLVRSTMDVDPQMTLAQAITFAD